MDVLSMCRICLVKDVQMQRLVNTKLQEIYEKLTTTSFQSVDSRPLQVCYLCYGKLQNCYRLQINCIKSEELFREILANNQLKPKQLLDMNTLKMVHPLVRLSCVPVNVKVKHDDEEEHNMEPVDMIHEHVKQEYIEDAEDNLTDEKLNTDYMEAGIIVKIEDVSEEREDTSNYGSNCNFAYKSDEVNVQDIQPDIININCTKLSDSTLVKPIEISKEINLDCVETNAVLQNPKHNKPLNKTKTTATLENNKIYKTKKSTEEKQKVNKTVVKNDENPFKCDICGKRFMRTQHLAQHIRVHTGEKPYKCDMCEKTFNQKQHLTQHIRLHTSEKPYKCDMCEKLFKLKHHLKQHNRFHTGERPFNCDICDKSFTQKHHLMQHKNIHTGDKPYKCDICEKCFMRKQDLCLHNRMHTGVKRYKCDLCEKAFYQKHHLILHTRRHTGEKPYKCDICDKAFNRNQNLKMHVRMHTGDKPLKSF